jgi:autotransporter-associated beta strand protein
VTFTTGANVGFDISAAGNNFQLTNNLNHGNGGLTFSATGGGTNRQMTLLGSNSAFTGTITVNSGKLNLGGDTGGGSNSVSASNALVINDGMVSLGQVFTNVNATIGALSGGTNAILNTLNGTGAGVRRLVVDQAINTTFAGRLQEDATNSRFLGLTKTGTGTLTLSGVNTYSGTTILSGGALRLSSTAAAGTGTLTQADATSTLEINVTGTITNNMSLYNVAFLQGANLSGALTLNNTVFDVTNNVTATNSGTLSGSGGVDKIGAGTLVLSGANIYEGGTTISNGAVSVSSDGNLGLLPVAPEAGNVTLNGGKLLATSGFTLGANRGISVGASGGTVEVAASQNLGYGGIVSGLGALTKAGAGTFTLSGSSSFSGATTVSGGVLELANSSGSALGSVASVSVATNATLLISQGGQVNDGASISLSGGTIRTATGVSEAFGDLTVTGSGFLDFGTTSYANANTITFGTYTPSALLTIDNFNFGSTLVFKGSNLSGSINNTSLFTFTNGGIASSSWDSGSNTFTITAIPEPSAAVAMLGLLMFCLWPVCSPLFRSRSQKGNSL